MKSLILKARDMSVYQLQDKGFNMYHVHFPHKLLIINDWTQSINGLINVHPRWITRQFIYYVYTKMAGSLG